MQLIGTTNPIQAGQKKLSARDYNTMRSQVAAMTQAGGIDGNTISLRWGKSGVKRIMRRAGSQSDPFCFEVFDEDSDTIAIRCGAWARYGYEYNRLSAPYNDGGGSGTSDDPDHYFTFDVTALASTGTWYIVAYLTRDDTDHHYEIAPETIAYNYTKDFSTWHSAMTLPSGGDKWNRYKVLGAMTIASVSGANVIESFRQLWWGGDMDDLTVIPDGTLYSANGRLTIEWNPEDTVQQGELQLANVDALPANCRGVPFFLAGNDDGQGQTSGTLNWGLVDSHITATDQMSLELRGVGANPADYILQIYDMDSAASGAALYALTTVATGVKAATWQYPVSVSGDPILVAPYGVATAVSDNMITDITSDGDEGDGVAWYYRTYRPITISNGKIVYGAETVDAEPLGLGLYVNWGSVNNTYKNHTGLADMPQTYGSVTSHDTRYIVKGSAYNTTGANAYLASLGYGSGETANPELRIDLATYQLGMYSGGGSPAFFDTLDWNDCLLTDSSDKLSVNWLTRTLYETNGTAIVLNWSTQTLYSEDGATLRADWQNGELYDGADVVLNWMTQELNLTWTVKETTGVLHIDGDLVIDSGTGDVYVDATVGADLDMDGSALFWKGLFVNVSNASVHLVQVLDPNTGDPVNLYVLGKVAT